MSFSKKDIRVTFMLGAGNFNAGNNTKIISGLACSFNIEQVAAPDFNKCQGKIYNMKIDDIAKLTTLSFEPLSSEKRNLIKLETTENGTDFTTVFLGEIENAYGDFNSAPNIALNINAMAGSFAMKLPASPLSSKGSVPAKELLNKLAQSAGYRLETDISANVNNVYFQGSVMQQIHAIARAIGAKVIIDNDILRVMKREQALKGQAVLISPESGLIGYPTFSNQGINISCLYNPNIKQQGLIQIKSVVPKASGTWRAIKVNHVIAANMTSGGDWKTQIEAVYQG